MSQKEISAVVAAGIVGTLVNTIAVILVVGAPFALFFALGRYVVAIIVAGALPFVYRSMSGLQAHLVAGAILTIVPSVLAKLVFGVGAPWALVMILNAVYAAAAITTYLVLTGRSRLIKRSPV